MNRWSLCENGIVWSIDKDYKLPHKDNVEMSGTLVSQVVEYGVDEKGELVLSQHVVYPRLRTIPNNTHASLTEKYEKRMKPLITVNKQNIKSEKPYEVIFNGILKIKSRTDSGVEIIRTLFPTREYQAVVQNISFVNTKDSAVTINISYENSTVTKRGCHGIYLLESRIDSLKHFTLETMETKTIIICYSGRKLLDSNEKVNAMNEETRRKEFVESLEESLQLVTPDDVLNRAFSFAKLRAAESVFMNNCGYLHSPGGLSFYAAIWTNDQAEYAGPLFPFLGEKNSIEATLNCYRLFMPFMGPDYHMIPSSIISEGVDIWEGAGDRGDAAMYAYGASRFALETGDKRVGEELWWAIEWCLEYCKRKLNDYGVIDSDSDELEGRFPSGNANLSTSSITYGALITASYLADELGKSDIAEEYRKRAVDLRLAINSYFGANVEGYDTYRYYEGNEKLRSWICLPLVMGIMDRKDETIRALFSPQLWTEDGLATESGDITYWDRSTIYGFRGVFIAGASDRVLNYLKIYSNRRTLGEHVPYAVEAYPEGSGRHLSAESALYCRIYTEGMFGISPTGFKSFIIKPSIPTEWEKVELNNIKAFNDNISILVENSEKEYKIIVSKNEIQKHYVVEKGYGIEVNLQEFK